MLTNKYRPKHFSDFIGFDDKTNIATAYLKSSNIFIFCGPNGSGRSSFSEVLAKSVLCSYTKTTDPCGQCLSCSSFMSGNNPAYKHVHSSVFTNVDDFNSFIFEDSDIKRAIIIQDADSLTEAMQHNICSLSENTFFFLCCQGINSFTDLLISKSLLLHFHYPEQEDLIQILKNISAHENISYQDTCIQKIAKECKNVPRSISHLEHISFFGDINSENTFKVLNRNENYLCRDIILNKNNPSVLRDLCIKFSDNYSVNKIYQFLADYLLDAYCIEGFDEELKSRYGKDLVIFSKSLSDSSRRSTHVSELICDIILLKNEPASTEVISSSKLSDKAIIERTNSRVLMQQQLIKKSVKKAQVKYTAQMLSDRLGIPCQRESG